MSAPERTVQPHIEELLIPREPRNRERGVALLFSLFAVILISAIAASLFLVATTETTVNYNYRSEEVAFFAARSGISEAADRMMVGLTTALPAIPPPASAPPVPGAVVYLINQGALATPVEPWASGNPYVDDELCHEGFALPGLTSTAPDVPCTTVPNGNGWYTTVASNAPWNSTAAALPYVWVRVTLKLNGSVSHLGSDGSTTDYYVNPSAPAGSVVCWNTVSEVVAPSPGTACPQGENNVYLITALAVANGARAMVQSEWTATSAIPSVGGTPQGVGLFANSSACSAITVNGNGTVDSYSTAGYNSSNASAAYAATQGQTGGNIGTFGSVSLSVGSVSLSDGARIGGNIVAGNSNVGSCPDGLQVAGNPNAWKMVPADMLETIPPNTPAVPVPPAPNPAPPTTDYPVASNTALTPGQYGNIIITSGNVTFAPGTYNINSLNIGCQSPPCSPAATVSVSPPGAVVFNIAGANLSGPPLSISGNGITSDALPYDLVFEYAGSGAVTFSGNSSFYAVVDAPNAALTYCSSAPCQGYPSFSGSGAFYGAMLGSTITDSGNGAIHFDTAINENITGIVNGPTVDGYKTIALRSLPY